MAKLPDNIKTGLEQELAGIRARLEVADDKGGVAADTVASLKRRAGEVEKALGVKRSAKKSTRPASAGAETREG